MTDNLRTVTNTEERHRLMPELDLLEAEAAQRATGNASAAAIERQEARGQFEFANSDVMPKTGAGDELLRQLGFQLGEDVKGDRLFRYAKLPPGWTKRATDHSLWTDLVDGEGRKRGSIFYKAAFYDRDAFYSIKSWLEIGQGPRGELVVWGGGRILRSCGKMPDGLERRDAMRKEAKAWADEKFPGNEDPVAYWNLSPAEVAKRAEGRL